MSYTYQWADANQQAILRLDENGNAKLIETTDADYAALAALPPATAAPVNSPAPTADSIRAFRDRLLAGCDWTQLPDAPVDSTAWATYRAALRAVPDQAGFPTNVSWPTAP